MIRETWHAGHLVERWDGDLRTYTQWNDAGQQLAQRAFTTAENAVADIVMADQQQDANEATVDANLTGLIASLQADVAQDNSIITNANTVIATTGTLTTAQLSTYVRQLAQAVKTLANNDMNNKRALANLLHKVTDNYADLTGT